MRHRSEQTQLGLIESNVENDGLIIFCGTTRITVSLAADMALLQVSPAFRVIACGDLPELKPQGSRFTDFKGKRFKQKGFLNLRPSKPGMSGNWIDDEALETAYIGEVDS